MGARLRGFEGAVKSVDCHATLPLVSAGGLGRHLVVANYENNKQMAKVYLKQKITSVLFCDSVNKPKTSADKNDDIWEELDQQSTKRPRGEVSSDSEQNVVSK